MPVAVSAYLIGASLTFLYLRTVGDRAAKFLLINRRVLVWMALTWPLTVLWLVADILSERRERSTQKSRLH